LPDPIDEMRRRWVKNVFPAQWLARERASNDGHMAIENNRPVCAVAPEAFKSGRCAAGAEPELETAVRNQVEHRRVFGDADWLFERQGYDARAKTNSRRARRDMRQKDEWGRKAPFVPVKVVLGDPRRLEAVPLRVNDLLRSEPISLSCGRLIEKPSEETEPSGSRRRHVDPQPLVVFDRAKRGRDQGLSNEQNIRRGEEMFLRSWQSQSFRVLDGPLAPIVCESATAFRPWADLRACAVRLFMIKARNAVAASLDNRTLAELHAQTHPRELANMYHI
jgi:hypothetical protein